MCTNTGYNWYKTDCNPAPKWHIFCNYYFLTKYFLQCTAKNITVALKEALKIFLRIFYHHDIQNANFPKPINFVFCIISQQPILLEAWHFHHVTMMLLYQYCFTNIHEQVIRLVRKSLHTVYSPVPGRVGLGLRIFKDSRNFD